MKKLISLLLCLALLCCCAMSFAEAASGQFTATVRDRFRLTGPLPEGYQYSIVSQDDLTTRASVTSTDPAAPVMTLIISYNESYGDVKLLNDLPDDQLNQIKAGFSEMNEVTFDLRETSHGTKLLIVRETGADLDFLDFYTIYLGHEIELRLAPGEGASDPTLTEEQIQKCITFLSDLDFSPIG
jgi:hypothetical protein